MTVFLKKQVSDCDNFRGVTRLRAFPGLSGARRGNEGFSVLIIDPPRGRPFGGGGVHHNKFQGRNYFKNMHQIAMF